MPDAGPAAQRRRLGALCAAFGVLHLLPALFSALSAGGPAPFTPSGRAWSAFYYGHFVALVAAGYGWLYLKSRRTKVFHGGPALDFTIGLGALTIASSFGRGWIPGAFLVVFGLRLMDGRALIR